MLPELPQWATLAISSVIGAALMWVVNRALNSATIDEKKATALNIMTEVSEDLARQLRQVQLEVPVWKQQIASEIAARELAEAKLDGLVVVRDEAANIVDEMQHLTYISGEDEPETSVERRFKSIKRSAVKIKTALDTLSKKPPPPSLTS